MFRFQSALLKTSKLLVKPPVLSSVGKFGTYKTTTGLTGLNVDPSGRENLLKYSNKVLEEVQKIPECAFKEETEQFFKFFVKVANETVDIREIEEKIDLGQIEELIEMSKDQLRLVNYYYDHKGWELVEDAKRTADTLIPEMSDVLFFTNPERKPVAYPPVPPSAEQPAAAAAEKK